MNERMGCLEFFTVLLQIAFIVLKLAGFIDWGWFYVLLPFIGYVGLFVVIFVAAFVITIIASVISYIASKM